MVSSLASYTRAVPLNAILAFGLDSRARRRQSPRAQLDSFQGNRDAVYWALQTAGTVGLRLLMVIAAHGGRVSVDQLGFETRDADAGVIGATVDRLLDAQLIQPTTDPDGFALPAEVARLISVGTVSMSDPNLITTDALNSICRKLRARPPSLKRERIELISLIFADPERAAVVRDQMSPTALALLGRIADHVGVSHTTAATIGLDTYDIHQTLYPSYMYRHSSPGHSESPDAAALRELVGLGIVGVSDWEDNIWVWREAWPLLHRPYYTHWQVVSAPELAAAEPLPARVPAIVGTLDTALEIWRTDPPAALKSQEARLARTIIKSLAKSLHVSVIDFDVMSRLAIGIGLIEIETLSASGRGRNRRYEQVWRPDPELSAAWAQLKPINRWLRLVDEWCRPGLLIEENIVANRHLLLWELANLPEDRGWADETHFITWFTDRYAVVARAETIINSLVALRSLGVVNPEGPIRLTRLGSAALSGPEAVARITLGQSTKAIVQADHTVIAPPDLRADIASQLCSIAKVESDAGAFIYRLDADLITRAVQSGQSAEEIVTFLTELSQVAIGRAVTQFVQDAADQADRFLLLPAASVLVAKRAADLKLACVVRPAQLTPVSDTVAVSDLPPAKVRTALERRGLSPALVIGGAGSAGTGSTSSPNPESSARAKRNQQSQGGSGSGPKGPKSSPGVPAALKVTGPLGLTPNLVADLDEDR